MELESIPAATAPPIPLQTCRSCTGYFTAACADGRGTVIVVAGVPRDVRYKAVSHVWGEVVLLHQLQCTRCEASFAIPLSSEAKFHHIVNLAVGSTIWWDVLSIDQRNLSDIQSQVSQMGNIYEQATSVEVLLPETDEPAYRLLDELTTAAKLLFKNKVYFEKNKDKKVNATQRLSDIAKSFFRDLQLFGEKLSSWTYWRRAWTFQEWTLAHDITLALEGQPGAFVKNVKSSIFATALMVSEYKLEHGRHAAVDLGFERGEVMARFDVARRLFPYENALLSYDEIDDSLRRFQTFFPHYTEASRLGGPILDARTPSRKTDDLRWREYAMGFGIWCEVEKVDESAPPTGHPHEGTDQLLGIRLTPRTEEARFPVRLRLMLDAFGVCRRKTRHAADLVACWASMCNIAYDYRKDDPLEVAIAKVVTVLRGRGITIFNFVVHGPPAGPRTAIDARFLDFASTQSQCNANSRAVHPGAPIFTGRADTAALVRILMHHDAAASDTLPETLRPPAVPLRQVAGAAVVDCVVMDQTDAVLDRFRDGIAANLEDLTAYNVCVDADAADGASQLAFTDVVDNLREILAGMPPADRATKLLILLTIPFRRADGAAEPARVWAIFSAGDSTAHGALGEFVVAREGVNGTLVLVQRRRGSLQVMAYLLKTDHLYGTFVLTCRPDGHARWVMTTPRRTDRLMPQTCEDRVVTGTFPLAAEEMYDGPGPESGS